MNEKYFDFFFNKFEIVAISLDDSVMFTGNINANYHEFIDYINS